VAALIAAGVPVRTADLGARVEAGVMIGQEGRARAGRLGPNSSWNLGGMGGLLGRIGLWEAVAALPAQGLGTNSKLYQVLGPPISDFTVLDEGFGNRVVRGKPFSSVEERHSLQILRDGTHIETSQKNRLFRDGQGRTRVEQMNGGATIEDVV